ncbi:MAG: transposase [Bdellovibrionota bacterium]
MTARQLSLLPTPRREHGGSTRAGKRKEHRPIDTKRSIHVVMRATQARGQWSMLKKKPQVEALLKQTAKDTGIRIYGFVNVGNHLHLLARTKKRADFQRFLRIFAGRVAMLVTGAKKGNALKARFWDKLAYTRLVSWGREFVGLKQYLMTNLAEVRAMPSWLEISRIFTVQPRGRPT